MLDLVNEKTLVDALTVEDRKSIFLRALHTAPYFNDFEIDLPSLDGLAQPVGFKSRSHIYIDYCVTEVRTNLGDVQINNGGEYFLSIYEAESGLPLLGYNKSDPLPFIHMASNCPFDTHHIANSWDDRQREFMPYVLHAGDDAIVQLTIPVGSEIPSMAHVTLCGFNLQQTAYINDDEQQKINKSLALETVFQTFQLEVDHTGHKIYNIFNDNTPRLILGIGVINEGIDPRAVRESKINIFDTIRHLRITNQAMLLESIAPRVPQVKDSHIYYLPIEHYFCPFGNIQFDIENTHNIFQDTGYKLVMLTRTV